MEAFHPVVYGEGGYDPEVVSSPSNPYSWGEEHPVHGGDLEP
jgi:hypothetical protein